MATRPFYGQVSIRQPNTPTSEPRERIFGWQYTFFFVFVYSDWYSHDTLAPNRLLRCPLEMPTLHQAACLEVCGLLLTPSVLCLHCVARCTQLLPTPQGMPLTASHAPLLTLHMLWIDLSKSFMTFSRAVGQLLQAKAACPHYS